MFLANLRKYTYAQIPVALFNMGESALDVILNDYLEYSECITMNKENAFECNVLHDNTTSSQAHLLEEEIQPTISLIIAIQNYIENLLPALLIIFWGSWSDTNGRKPILILVMISSLLKHLILLIISLFFTNPWAVLVAFVPPGLTGGFLTALVMAYTYIFDISSLHDRSWQISYILVIIACGSLTGEIIGRLVFDSFGYSSVFFCTFLVNVVGLLYLIYFVPESLMKKDENEKCITTKFSDVCSWRIPNTLFRFAIVRQTIDVIYKKHEGSDRYVIWTCIITIILCNMVNAGESAVLYLFTEARLGWNVDMYTYYLITSIIFGRIIGTAIGAYALKYLTGISESFVAFLFAICTCIEALIISLAKQTWHMYLAKGFGMFSLIIRAVLRSILSKLVPEADLGKVFGLLLSLETIMGIVGTTLSGLIYAYTMPPMYPSPVWLTMLALNLIVVTFTSSIHFKMLKTEKLEK